jgi:hypothetical protein
MWYPHSTPTAVIQCARTIHKFNNTINIRYPGHASLTCSVSEFRHIEYFDIRHSWDLKSAHTNQLGFAMQKTGRRTLSGPCMNLVVKNFPCVFYTYSTDQKFRLWAKSKRTILHVTRKLSQNQKIRHRDHKSLQPPEPALSGNMPQTRNR